MKYRRIFFLLLIFLFSQAFLEGELFKIKKIELWKQGLLRGANIYQRKVYPELDGNFMGNGYIGPPYSLNDFMRLAKAGANYVNISCPGVFTEKPPYKLDDKILENLDRLINLAEAANLFVVISFRTGPGRSEFTFFYGEDTESDPDNGWFSPDYYNDEVWESKEAQKAWAEMWKFVAERYKDSKVVVGYDLMVEPNSNDVFFDIWEPEDFYTIYKGTTYDWNQFYPKIVKKIREVDPYTPILIQPLSYGDIKWFRFLNLIAYPNLVYDFHQYDPHVYTHQNEGDDLAYPGYYDVDWDNEPESFDKIWLEHLISRVSDFAKGKNITVSVNEYGAVRYAPGLSEFYNDMLKIFENNKYSHAIWMWYPKWEPFDLISEFNFLYGTDSENLKEIKNPLSEVIFKGWSKNKINPSNVIFTDRRKKGKGGRR